VLFGKTMLSRQSIEGPANPDKVSKIGEKRPEVRLILAAPRGFCAGVRRAIDAVRDALSVHGAPVYVRRAIVHNLEVVRTLEAEDAIFVSELDEAPSEINRAELPDGGVIGVFAAASTPETSVQEIIAALSVRYRLIVEEVETVREATVFKRLAIP
jgi:4-hydroxy-3-methylbut-2-enyl diphosphate reductase IspH